MSEGTTRIEITFPEAVELPSEWEHRLINLVTEACRAYEAAHPGRVMWPSGFGSKITYMPMTADEEKTRGIEFDNSTLSIECYERERYHRWFVPKGSLSSLGECCRDCGMVRRVDDENGPCRGPVSVSLRDNASPAAHPGFKEGVEAAAKVADDAEAYMSGEAAILEANGHDSPAVHAYNKSAAVAKDIAENIRSIPTPEAATPEWVEQSRDAMTVALGHLTGGMDGDWRDCDPKDLLRKALRLLPPVKP